MGKERHKISQHKFIIHKQESDLFVSLILDKTVSIQSEGFSSDKQTEQLLISCDDSEKLCVQQGIHFLKNALVILAVVYSFLDF